MSAAQAGPEDPVQTKLLKTELNSRVSCQKKLYATKMAISKYTGMQKPKKIYY